MSKTGQVHSHPRRDIEYNGPAKVQLMAMAEIERRKREGIHKNGSGAWPSSPLDYYNIDRRKYYRPHHQEEWSFIMGYEYKRFTLLRGGEGGGKSVAGIIRDLEKIKLGVDGIIGSPDLPHFKRSLWPEMRRWIPWDHVVPRERYRGKFDWEPQGSFMMHFKTGSTIYFMGFQEALSLEGPNVHFAHMDEARRLKNAAALKALNGRIRIPGPNGEAAQMWLTTTPRMNWLYEYFGVIDHICLDCKFSFESEDVRPLCPKCESDNTENEDPWLSFKEELLRVTLLTKDNEENLDHNFVEDRGRTLTEAEKRVLLWAEWEDIDEGQPFIPDMSLWDNCRGEIPPVEMEDQIVVALDASINNDCFVLIGVSFHPDDRKIVAIRFLYIWEPKGIELDYLGTEDEPGPERILRWLCHDKSGRSIPSDDREFIDSNIVLAVYDQYQLHAIMTTIKNEGITWVEKFGQQSPRLEADKFLLDKIMQKGIMHDGNPKLRQHIDNADRRLDNTSRKLRIVKRMDSKKIDLTVGLSMALYALYEHIGEPIDESPFF
jgi:hypothetical protein